jgi:hypothetical protein
MAHNQNRTGGHWPSHATAGLDESADLHAERLGDHDGLR